MARLRTANEAFLQGFLLPLIQGGRVVVAHPLGRAAIRELEAEAVGPLSESLLEVDEARRRCAAGLWLYPVPLGWDAASVRLAAAAHNLLFLSHPDTERWTARASRLARVARFTAELLALPAPASGAEAVARHTLVGNLWRVAREDVVLDTWLMIYSFRGQEPPAGLRRFPGLRRVRESRRRVRWTEDQSLQEIQRELLAELLRASPLTDLLTPLRVHPTFSFSETAPYLRWRWLARLVCQRYLETGLQQLGGVLSAAFWEMLASPAGPDGRTARRRVLGMLVYLCTVAQLGAAAPLGGDQTEPLAQLPTLLAVVASCGLLPRELEAPLQERLDQLVRERQQALGTATISELAARLRAALE